MLFSNLTCAKSRVEEYWLLIEMLFNEIIRILPFENLRNNKERNNFIISSQSKLVGLTVKYAKTKFQNLRDIGFTFDTLIIDDSSFMDDIDLIFGLSCSSEY
jgi:intron-binding protein aquarius